MIERGDGRNRSEIPDLDSRLQALNEELAAPGLSDREFLFNVEAYAWATFQRLRAEIFERRYGMPASDADVFGLLQRHGQIDLVESRRLKQFCEARNLSSRDLAKIDFGAIREMAKDRAWIREILNRLKAVR